MFICHGNPRVEIMRLGSFVMLGFALGVVLYLMGSGPLINVFEQQNGKTILTFGNSNCAHNGNSNLQDPSCSDNKTLMGLFLGFLGLSVVLIGFTTGFSAIYYLPIVFLISVFTFFIFPFDFILQAPAPLNYILIAFFNIVMVLAGLSFIRGGNA